MSREKSSQKTKNKVAKTPSDPNILRPVETTSLSSPERASSKRVKVQTTPIVLIFINVKSIMAGIQDMKVEVTVGCRVRDLKLAIYDACDLLPERQLLLYQDKEIDKEDRTIASYGLVANCTITLSVRLATGIPIRRPRRIADLLLLAPKLFEAEGGEIRKVVRKLPTISQETSQKPSTEEKKEMEKTRNKMKALLSKRAKKKVSLLSFEKSRTSLCNVVSSSSISSLQSSTADEVDDNELKFFFECFETTEALDKKTQIFLQPPQDFSELEELKKFLEKKARGHCKLCKKKLSPTEQNLQCLCKKIFCKKHREPKKHVCPIDYKQNSKNELKKSQRNSRL